MVKSLKFLANLKYYYLIDQAAIQLFSKLGLPLFVSLTDVMDIDVQFILERIFNRLKNSSTSESGKKKKNNNKKNPYKKKQENSFFEYSFIK